MIRFFLLMMLVTAAFYLLVAIYTRSLRRERLEKDWAAERPEGIDRRSYVERGLELYDRSFRRRLLGLILIVPFIAVGIRIWLQNFSGHR